MLTQRELHTILHYAPETGVFTWLGTKRGRRAVTAGGNDGSGYCSICIDYKYYKAHRLAFIYMTGRVPKFVDHKNGVRTDNRWKNLRACTVAQNGANRRIGRNNSTGKKGVIRVGKKFAAQIYVSKRKIYLGSFACLEDAHAAYLAAAKKYFGEFASV